jgi:hypothetical protein
VLSEIKEELLKQPNAIVELLERFDFTHIKPSNKEIRFARDHKGGKNISIRLERNESLYVNDFARGVSKDIFGYIIQEKQTTFRDVIQATKRILNLDNDWAPRKKHQIFGGVYSIILRPNKEAKLKVYDENILNQYKTCGNLRFLNDGVSIEAQRFWDIRFSIEEDSIIIPLRNEYGELVGVKARINRNPQEGESKYYYPVPVSASQLLYGYSENYEHLYGNDVVVVESEKSVCQGWCFGAKNIVALGNNSISEKQAKLLLQLQPKRIIIAMDEGLSFEQTKRNADVIKSFNSIFTPEIWYWDSTMDLDIDLKSSPTDMGKEKYQEIMQEQLVRIY